MTVGLSTTVILAFSLVEPCCSSSFSSGTLVSGNIKLMRNAGIRRGSLERTHHTTVGSCVMRMCCGRMLKFIRCVRSKLAGSSDVSFGGVRRRRS